VSGRGLVVLTIDGDRLVRAERLPAPDGDRLDGLAPDATGALADAARRHPHDDIAWCDVALRGAAAPVAEWPGRLRHVRELRHAGFLHRDDPAWRSIGAVEFASPLVLPAPAERAFATWLISPLAGVAAAELLAAVGPTGPGLPFTTAVLVMGHRALGAGAMLWSDPGLVTDPATATAPAVAWADVALAVRHVAGVKFLPSWLVAGGDGARALRATAAALRPGAVPPPAGEPPDLPPANGATGTVDVVLASLDRRALLLDVLDDLAAQSRPLHRVVVVEQYGDGPDPGPIDRDLPFELVHRRIRRIGAVHARNVALEDCDADWVLFVDDDVRLGPTAVEQLVATARQVEADAVTARVWSVAPGDAADPTRPPPGPAWPVMWSSFNTGGALASGRLVAEVGGFDPRLEGGFGEDHEWGVRARATGALVVYAPEVGIPHLKHGEGGLRRPHPHPWHETADEPQPSPTVLLSRRLYETEPMRRGWTIHYWFRRIRGGAWRSPVTSWRSWQAGQRWTDHLARPGGR
jgi:glycosyltransferase involved in cell wall biosynthesis